MQTYTTEEGTSLSIIWLIFWGILLVSGYVIRRKMRFNRHSDLPEKLGNKLIHFLGSYCYTLGAAGLLRVMLPVFIDLTPYTTMLNIILVSFVLTLTLVMFVKLHRLRVE